MVISMREFAAKKLPSASHAGGRRQSRYDDPVLVAGKPIIGIAGGIGSGKSFVADLFGEMGAMVIKADKLVHDAYDQPDVKETLRQWWGDEVFKSADRETIDTAAVAKKIFHNTEERKRLESLLHPIVVR